jgi:hypothetical protein
MSRPVEDPAQVAAVAAALEDGPLPFSSDPHARVVRAEVDADDPTLLHVHWRYRGVIRTFDTSVSQEDLDDGGPEDAASLLKWHIVEEVETGEWQL